MLKILVIDDSSTVLLSVRGTLAGAGYGVSTCNSARAAMRMATQESFDLIVTDIYMPDGDGLEVIRDLRRVRPNIPFIAMSGMTGQRDMLRVAKFLGASQTLQKPFLAKDLLAAVEAMIGKSPTEADARSDFAETISETGTPGSPAKPAEQKTSGQPKQGEDSR
jgi:DNA-binding response OmpR family regulator